MLDQKTNVQPPSDRVYEDFDPPSDWDHDEGSETLILMLPGFRKEQMKVQITSTRILKLSGERKISENKWRRFRKELSVPPDSDTSRINARFESGILYVRLPKVTPPIKSQPPTMPTQEAPKPQQPTAEAPDAQVAADQQKPRVDKAAEAKTEKTEAPAPTPMAPTLQEREDSQKKPPKEKGKAETDANKVARDKERAEATTSKAQEMHETGPDGLGKDEAKMDKRSPTLLLSRQTQEYKNALSGLIEGFKKQKKVANLLVVIFLVLVFVLYVKNAIKSSFGGSKSQEL